jgi:NADPH-dependent F420 reductase
MSRIAFLGGTGPHGVGMALRFALAGEEVVIGSRRQERAEQAAHRIHERLAALGSPHRISSGENRSAVESADVVVLTVPFDGVEPLLVDLAPLLAGKIILDVVNPVVLAAGRFQLAPLRDGSAAELIQSLAPQSVVVSGFKHISASDLWHAERALRGDVLLCGNVPEAKQRFIDLVGAIPHLRAVDAGGLANASFLESITALLLNLNQQHHKVTSIQILGL